MVWKPQAVLLGDSRLVRAGSWRRLDDTQACTILDVSSDELTQFLQDPLCLLVPEPVLHLICAGAWQALVVASHWLMGTGRSGRSGFIAKLGIPGYPDPAWLKSIGKSGRKQGAHRPMKFRPQDAAEIASRLRTFAPAIIDAELAKDENAPIVFELEQMVSRLNALGDVGIRPCDLTEERKCIDPHKLLQSFCAAMGLKHRSHLRQLVLKAIAGMSGCPELHEMDLSNMKLPAGATLSRAQVKIDAALCCHWASKLRSHDGPIFVFADASPQVGVDWLLSTVILIENSALEARAKQNIEICFFNL